MREDVFATQFLLDRKLSSVFSSSFNNLVTLAVREEPQEMRQMGAAAAVTSCWSITSVQNLWHVQGVRVAIAHKTCSATNKIRLKPLRWPVWRAASMKQAVGALGSMTAKVCWTSRKMAETMIFALNSLCTFCKTFDNSVCTIIHCNHMIQTLHHHSNCTNCTKCKCFCSVSSELWVHSDKTVTTHLFQCHLQNASLSCGMFDGMQGFQLFLNVLPPLCLFFAHNPLVNLGSNHFASIITKQNWVDLPLKMVHTQWDTFN